MIEYDDRKKLSKICRKVLTKRGELRIIIEQG